MIDIFQLITYYIEMFYIEQFKNYSKFLPTSIFNICEMFHILLCEKHFTFTMIELKANKTES